MSNRLRTMALTRMTAAYAVGFRNPPPSCPTTACGNYRFPRPGKTIMVPDQFAARQDDL